VPGALTPVIAFALLIALTGAIHVDGFLDTCDAVFTPATPERRREILKDPHHGTFAVAYFAVAAALWLAALFALPATSLEQTLAFAAGGARFATVLNAADRRPSRPVLGLNAALLLWLAWTIAPWAWILLAALVALAWGQAALLRRALGMLTGDAYGCTIVCGEIAGLLALAVCLSRP
jgi:adenosylcobinamide-GDP ribazoletransferase